MLSQFLDTEFYLMYWYTWNISKSIQMIEAITVDKMVILYMIVPTIIHIEMIVMTVAL